MGEIGPHPRQQRADRILAAVRYEIGKAHLALVPGRRNI